MSELFLIIKDKGDPKTLGELMMKLAHQQPIDLSWYDCSMANNLEHLIYSRKEEIADFIFETGLSNFIETMPLNEDVVPAGSSRSNNIKVIRKYLAKLQIDNELIIVDPFFFAPTKVVDYPGFIKDVFSPFIPSTNTLRIITTDVPSKVDRGIKTAIETKFKALNPTLNIYHKQSSDYHDRYIISHGRENGIVVGTSLNGLGYKLALVDKLNKTDVREIVADLTANGLI